MKKNLLLSLLFVTGLFTTNHIEAAVTPPGWSRSSRNQYSRFAQMVSTDVVASLGQHP